MTFTPVEIPSPDRTPSAAGDAPRVVVVGAGFGGLSCAMALGGSRIRVTIVDRVNYHLFVPLLYQVATAALSPADIAAPVRRVMARHPNIDTVLGEVCGVDTEGRRVMLKDGGHLPYDALVIATGSVYNYFGNDAWAEHAPGVRTIENARAIRARLLKAFEAAEIEPDPERRDALLTIVVIGGGPTGVEMAGTIAELARYTLAGDFRRIDPRWAKVILIESGSRLLASFPPRVQSYALQTLTGMGVEVRLNTRVETIDAGGVVAAGERIEASSVIWGAGIKAAPARDWFGAMAVDRQERLMVEPNLALPGVPDVFVVGDLASFKQNGKALPALAQVAKQQGLHLGKALRRRLPRATAGRPLKMPRFRYRSRGDTAVIGRSAAVFVIGPLTLTKGIGWALWGFVHVYLLIGFDRRMSVASQWIWRYLTSERGARLID
jgi:NADH:ubiquinone reductase (H+-translocating)